LATPAERPLIDPSLIRRPKSERKSIASKARPRGRDLQYPLADITRRLQVISAVAITAEIALKTQNCEQDSDIAACLRHGVVDALTTQIERICRLPIPAAVDAP
jgi:hypothetical protein